MPWLWWRRAYRQQYESEFECISIFTIHITNMLPISSPMERKVLAIATEMHTELRQTAQLETREKPVNAQQCFQQVHQHAMSLLNQLDEIPLDVLRVAEKFMREKRRLEQERTADALNKQKRYDLMRRQIENHFSKVAQFRRVQINLQQKLTKTETE